MSTNKVVLMYHDIVAPSDKTSGFQNESAFQYKVEEANFEEQVRALKGRDVVFSFDDGGISFLRIAAPILEKYGYNGIFFIATDYIGTPGFLNAEQLKELDSRGHIIGSHSCSHPHNMAELADDTIEKEWKESKRVLEEILGHKVEYASIPNGYSSKTVIEKAKQAGIKYLYTSTPLCEMKKKDGLILVGRYVIHDKMTAVDVSNIVFSSFIRRKKYIKWLALELIKMFLGRNYDKVKALLISK